MYEKYDFQTQFQEHFDKFNYYCYFEDNHLMSNS